MTKITFIGAGSTVFAKNLLTDVLSYEALQDATITLFDVDPHRLALSERVGHRIAELLGAHPTIQATTDREAALDGADFAINMIQVGGYEPSTVIDFEIPKRFGLRQTIGDTLGIGGIMRTLRTAPVLLGMARDMERLAPDVLHLNYVNPMAMNCMALDRGSRIRTVGLCHSVPHTAGELAADLGVPANEIDYLVAGVNHVAFFLKLQRGGADLYPALRDVAASGRIPDHNRVRYEMFHRLGYFVTESSEHFAEYVPWFIKAGREDLIERFHIPLDEYLYRCQASLRTWEVVERELTAPGSTDLAALRTTLSATPLMPTVIDGAIRDVGNMWNLARSAEYGSSIIHAAVTGEPTVVYGNVPNRSLIDGLPEGCCVEVPCLIDANGVQPTRIGALPPQLTALIQTQVNVQQLAVEAVITGKREHVYHAAMLDPHTGAQLDLEQIWALVDALLDAHGDMIPEALRS